MKFCLRFKKVDESWTRTKIVGRVQKIWLWVQRVFLFFNVYHELLFFSFLLNEWSKKVSVICKTTLRFLQTTNSIVVGSKDSREDIWAFQWSICFLESLKPFDSNVTWISRAAQHFLIGGMRNQDDRKTDSDRLLPPHYPTATVTLDPDGGSQPPASVLPRFSQRQETSVKRRGGDGLLTADSAVRVHQKTGSRRPFSGADELLREECVCGAPGVFMSGGSELEREGFVACVFLT